MCRNRAIFENIVLFLDHNYYDLSRRNSLIVNYKQQFRLSAFVSTLENCKFFALAL